MRGGRLRWAGAGEEEGRGGGFQCLQAFAKIVFLTVGLHLL